MNFAGCICATLLKKADVYFFDEPSSYLDIYERMIVRLIQELSNQIIVIEHDLAVLDVIADLTHIVYGKKVLLEFLHLLELLEKQLMHILRDIT